MTMIRDTHSLSPVSVDLPRAQESRILPTWFRRDDETRYALDVANGEPLHQRAWTIRAEIAAGVIALGFVLRMIFS